MYQAILFAEDGDYITDYPRETVEEVWRAVDDGGSRWIFYPVPMVITADRGGAVRRSQRIIAAPPGFEHVEGRTVETAIKEVRKACIA